MKTLIIKYKDILIFELNEKVVQIDDGFSENRQESVNIIQFLIENIKNFEIVEVKETEDPAINEILKIVAGMVEKFLEGYNKKDS